MKNNDGGKKMSFDSDFAKETFSLWEKVIQERDAKLIEKGRQQAFDEVRKVMDAVKESKEQSPFEIEIRHEYGENIKNNQLINTIYLGTLVEIKSGLIPNHETIRINGNWYAKMGIDACSYFDRRWERAGK